MAEATEQFTRFKQLMAGGSLPALGPQGRPGTLGVADLDQKLSGFFTAERLPDDVQLLLRSAALLWHDHLDASHGIAQNMETREAAWLHGIMHRREPDYGNAKYWFQRVGRHDAFPSLARKVTELVPPVVEISTFVRNGDWQPLALVDLCERAEQGNDAALASRLQRIQAAEFDVLVQHILSNA